MPRMYAIEVAAVSVSAAQDLFAFVAATDHPIELYALVAGQSSSTTQENLGISVVVGNTTVGSGGSAATPRKIDPGDAAASFTARINDTTVASGGSAETKHTDAWNLLSGYSYVWHDEAQRPKTNATNGRMCVRITAPAAGRTVRATAYVIER